MKAQDNFLLRLIKFSGNNLGGNLEEKKKLFLLGLLYLSQGIPVYFFTLGLPTILRNQGIHLEMLGLIGLLGLPWAIKFLWAPLVDRFYFPRMGKRKSWILPLQISLALLFLLLSQFPPSSASSLIPVFVIGLFVVLLSATQDIAIDGWAIETLSTLGKGMGNAMQGVGASLGIILGGTLVLYLYEYLGWEMALLLLSIMVFIPSLVLSFMVEEKGDNKYEEVDRDGLRPNVRNFFRRPQAWWILLFCLVYRLSEGLLMGIQSPFLIDLHFSPTQVGIYLGIWGGLLGPIISITAGVLLRKRDPFPILAFLGGLKILCYVILALGLSFFSPRPIFYVGMILFHTVLRYGILVALYTFFMHHCSLKQAGTDFSIMGCVDLFFYILVVSSSGFLASSLGYSLHFLLAACLAFTSLLFLPYFRRKILFAGKDEQEKKDQGLLLSIGQ